MSLKSFYEQFEGRLLHDGLEHVTITKQEYEEIQLYAWKEGMTRAAMISRRKHGPPERETSPQEEDIAQDIESDRDYTDTLWPRPMI